MNWSMNDSRSYRLDLALSERRERAPGDATERQTLECLVSAADERPPDKAYVLCCLISRMFWYPEAALLGGSEFMDVTGFSAVRSLVFV